MCVCCQDLPIYHFEWWLAAGITGDLALAPALRIHLHQGFLWPLKVRFLTLKLLDASPQRRDRDRSLSTVTQVYPDTSPLPWSQGPGSSHPIAVPSLTLYTHPGLCRALRHPPMASFFPFHYISLYNSNWSPAHEDSPALASWDYRSA